MNHNRKKRIGLGLLVILVLMAVCMTGFIGAVNTTDNESTAESNAEGSRGILFKAQNGGVTVYLLGSIHIGTKEMYPFGEEIRKAMDASDTFVFECDTTSDEAMQAALTMMYYRDGNRIADVISAEVYQKLADVCVIMKTSLASFDRMRPWAVTSQLGAQVAAMEMGADNAYEAAYLGVDVRVSEFARKNGKAKAYLETTRGQLEMLDSMSMPLQEFMLNETLTAVLEPESVHGMDSTVSEWPGWWCDGNITAFVDGYLADMLGGDLDAEAAALLSEYYDIIVTRRNRTMADTVEGYLQGQDEHTYFVTVGLLHLVLPDDSIVKELTDRGYAVECLSEP